MLFALNSKNNISESKDYHAVIKAADIDHLVDIKSIIGWISLQSLAARQFFFL